MEILASRILSSNREIRGHVDSEASELCKNAFDFFCNKFKEESSEDAAWDTQEEFKVNVHIKNEPNMFDNERRTYDVYISKKEHS